MLKVFSFGIFLGLAIAGVTAFFTPVADLHRETSLVSVLPNGGVVEIFKIRIPEDRIMAGTADSSATQPGNLKWPQELTDAGVEMELFKLRNSDDVVVGVASRLVGTALFDYGADSQVIEWVLNLPARGSTYYVMDAEPDADGIRRGFLRAGTREYSRQTGAVRERFVAKEGGAGGYIELQATSIGIASPEEDGGEE